MARTNRRSGAGIEKSWDPSLAERLFCSSRPCITRNSCMDSRGTSWARHDNWSCRAVNANHKNDLQFMSLLSPVTVTRSHWPAP